MASLRATLQNNEDDSTLASRSIPPAGQRNFLELILLLWVTSLRRFFQQAGQKREEYIINWND